MVNVFDDTPEDKERHIVDILQRGYTYKSIMKECHVSPSTISNVKRAMFGSTDDDNLKQRDPISIETQALKLFKEGKKPIEVATELDIATDYVFVIHERYQRLRNLEGFNSAFEHVEGNIGPYLRLFDLMNGLGMTPEQVAEQVKYSVNLPHLQNIHTKMNNQIHDMASRHCYLDSQLQSTEQQVQQYKNSLQFYDNECTQKINEIKSLCSTIDRKKRVIRWLDNSKGYDRIKEAAEKETKLLLQDNRALLALTVFTVLEAVRKYDATRELIFKIVTSSSATTCGEPWIESHKSRLVELSEQIQMEMTEQLTNGAISNLEHKLNQEL
jgi:uncharacterized protein YerC